MYQLALRVLVHGISVHIDSVTRTFALFFVSNALASRTGNKYFRLVKYLQQSVVTDPSSLYSYRIYESALIMQIHWINYKHVCFRVYDLSIRNVCFTVYALSIHRFCYSTVKMDQWSFTDIIFPQNITVLFVISMVHIANMFTYPESMIIKTTRIKLVNL
jgi:hypothetical protein